MRVSLSLFPQNSTILHTEIEATHELTSGIFFCSSGLSACRSQGKRMMASLLNSANRDFLFILSRLTQARQGLGLACRSLS